VIIGNIFPFDQKYKMKVQPNIKPLIADDFDNFFIYLNKQLSHNGKDGSHLFMPISRTQSIFPDDKRQSFVNGLSLTIGEPRWRRAWIIANEAKQIIAHVDLRALSDPCTQHRTLLGLSVLKEAQGKGHGEALTKFAIDWVKDNEILEIIDLSVLSKNMPAIKLYEKLGFIKHCEIKDMFRIDGQSESHIIMSKTV
jgi:ribosomal protein S18 acetylase RimI-like enzyme